MSRVSALALAAIGGAACVAGSGTSHPDDTGLSGLALTAVAPGSLVPGSRVVLTGESFVDAPFGDTRLRLRGTFGGTRVDVTLAPRFVDYRHLDLPWPGGRAAGLPGEDGVCQGDAIVEVTSAIDYAGVKRGISRRRAHGLQALLDGRDRRPRSQRPGPVRLRQHAGKGRGQPPPLRPHRRRERDHAGRWQPRLRGVFVESFFGFSLHPGRFVPRPVDGADALFDAILDPFRPDVDGAPVLAADLAGVPALTSGAGCPASDRRQAVACAVWVLGSMIGTTMTHEIGHSLGLAEPGEPDVYHNPGDRPNRLMDAGGARTQRERAELAGEGPAVFCDGDYDYLRRILPAAEPPPAVSRPPCD